MSHTPGPWEVVRLSGVGGPCAIRMAYKPPSGRTFYGVQAIYLDADARLIAAAPELLEACRFFLTSFGAVTEQQQDALTLASRAIAKAEGKI